MKPMKRSKAGQGLVEYALILVLVAIVAVAIRAILGPQIGNVFSQITYVLSNPPSLSVFAIDDIVTTAEGSAVTMNVAKNDKATNSAVLPGSVTLVPGSGPFNGTLDINGDGTAIYTPNSGFTGVDSFRYDIYNDKDQHDEVQVSIGVGEYAIAVDDFYSTVLNTSITIEVSDGDEVASEIAPNTPRKIGSGPDNGTVDSNEDSTFTYTPYDDFEGADHFYYEICNTEGMCDTAAVTIDVTHHSESSPAAAVESATITEESGKKQAEPGSAEYMLEMMELLWEASDEQEKALGEALLLLEEGMLEALEAPIEFAAETGNELLFEKLSAIQQKADGGEYDDVVALATELNFLNFSLPEDVLVRAIAKFLPRSIAACEALNGQEVPFETFAGARQAMVLLGALDGAAAMDEIWEIIEPRNAFIEESQLSC